MPQHFFCALALTVTLTTNLTPMTRDNDHRDGSKLTLPRFDPKDPTFFDDLQAYAQDRGLGWLLHADGEDTNDSSIIIDSGATHHFFNDRKYFSNTRSAHGYVTVANGKKVRIEAAGDVRIVVRDANGYERIAVLRGALYVPKMSKNLLSVDGLCSAGHEVHFNKSGQCSTIVFDGGTMPGWTTVVEHKGRSYRLPHFVYKTKGALSAIASTATALNTSSHPMPDAWWHRVFGHCNTKDVRSTANRGHIEGVNVRDNADKHGSGCTCIPCTKAKFQRAALSKVPHTPTHAPLDVVDVDLYTVEAHTFRKERFCITFTDRHTR